MASGGRIVKMVLAVRTDLKMSKGKIASQCAHAAVSAVCGPDSSAIDKSIMKEWRNQGQPKVVCRVATEKELVDLHRKASKYNVPYRSIRDAGHTQVTPGSLTVTAFGPEDCQVLDKVTGHLSLL